MTDTRKPDIYMMVGPSSCGKTTWAKEFLKTSEVDNVHLSSDNIRMELFGELDGDHIENRKERNNRVFTEMKDRVKQALEDGTQLIIYDATNLSRKRRRVFYEQFSKKATISIHYFVGSLGELIRRAKERPIEEQLTEYKIHQQWISQQPPRIGVDCDNFTVHPYGQWDIPDEDWEHDNPHHKESIYTHTLAAKQEFMDRIWGLRYTYGFYQADLLFDLVVFHDLGKFFTRERAQNPDTEWEKRTGLKHMTYNKHENMSANFYLFVIKTNKKVRENKGLRVHAEDSDGVQKVTEYIFQHMNAHNGFTDRQKRLNKLDDKDIEILKVFSEIDNKSKVAWD